MSLLKSVLPFLTNQAAWIISRGIGCSNFSGNFLVSFLLFYDFKILLKSRGGGTFMCLALSGNVRQMFFFFFIFLIWTEQFWIWFNRKLTKKQQKVKVFLILPSVWFLNFGWGLSIDSVVWLGSADTKICSQNAVIEELELTEKWKYPNFRSKV